MRPTRRAFLTTAALSLAAHRLQAAQRLHPEGPSPRPDVAAIDHNRILSAAAQWLNKPPVPITSLPSKRSPGGPQDFFSEADDWLPNPNSPTAAYLHSDRELNPEVFTAHSQALIDLSRAVSSLTAASVLLRVTQPEQASQYATHAAAHLRAWFVDPATRMNPSVLYGQLIPIPATGPLATKPRQSRFDGILETVQLVEVAQSIPFLDSAGAIPSEDLAAIKAWFAAYLDWLSASRLAGLARDQKDHHGSSWLLQSAAYTQLTAKDDSALTPLRHHYRAVTLRAQILADGSFPHELATANPYRNSLFNLDLLATACQLLSTRFDSVWTYELQDGPGIRSAIARHYPFILHRNAWPYLADASRFSELPLRQPSLLLAARAYDQPDYSELWKRLPPDPTDPILERTFPIRQPLLWVTHPRP